MFGSGEGAGARLSAPIYYYVFGFHSCIPAVVDVALIILFLYCFELASVPTGQGHLRDVVWVKIGKRLDAKIS